MKFEVNRDIFSDAVSFVVKLLPPRPTQPILSGVLLEARDGELSLSSFDYETSSRTSVDASIDAEGAVLVQGRLLAEIANRLPAAPVTIEREERGIVVRCGRASFTLPTMPIEGSRPSPSSRAPAASSPAPTSPRRRARSSSPPRARTSRQ